jgi:hypothetical protein
VGVVHGVWRGFVDCRLDGDARVVTFANGMVLRELIVDIDDRARRFSYAAVGGRLSHHNASFQVIPEGKTGCLLVWITDLLPNEFTGLINEMQDQGVKAMKRTLEAKPS